MARKVTQVLFICNKRLIKPTYIQPWNNEKDESVLYAPEVEEGDIMIVP